MLKIAVAHMTLAVRGVSIERSYDRDFVMVASGGNGGLHAPLITRELSIPRVILPVLPAHFSAVGMLMTDIRHDYVQTHARSLAEADFNTIRQIADAFTKEGKALLRRKVSRKRIRKSITLDIRYVGQEFYLATPVTDADLAREDRDGIRARFDEDQRHYGQSAPERPVEIVNVRAGDRPAREDGIPPARGRRRRETGAKPRRLPDRREEAGALRL